MNLIFEYAFDGGGNQGFRYVFDSIYENIKIHYPEINLSRVHTRELYKECDSPCGRCGISTLKIINASNDKTTVLNFWDRGVETMMHDSGWETLNVVHVIGGLGIYLTAEEIKEKYNIKFDPFLYPLEQLSSYNYIQQYRKPYILNEKIKKACFIGWVYDSRKQITDVLQKHPLFDIYDTNAGLRGENYYEKMSQYAMTLSLNGNGEWCLRDVESMGLGIPTLRSEMKTPFYKGLLPGINYIKGTEPSERAFMVYPNTSFQETADQFIAAAEAAINNEDLLISISKDNLEYYDKYLLPDSIVKEFFNVFDLEILK